MHVGEYSITTANAIRFIKDQGSFTADKFEALDPEIRNYVARHVSIFLLKLIDGIQKICGERDE